MDCVVPGHSVRTFCAAISALSKIGQDIYFDFDPMDGLCLRTLNDAKSAFCVVEFTPSFFERCTTPLVGGTSSSSRKRSHASVSNSNSAASASQSTSGSQDLRFNCRVPMRALVPVVRPRKGVVTLRIKSEGHDNNGNSNNNNKNQNLQLAFEFHLEIMSSSNQEHKPSWSKVVHKMGVAEVDNIAAVAPKEDCSELVAAPKVLLKWLEPIKRTAEACLIFTKDASTVVATSFNSSDTSGSSLATATKNILKTETSIALEDLEDYIFMDQRTEPVAEHDHLGMPQCPMPDNVNEEVVLVFGIREAKALLQFCSHGASFMAQHHPQHWGGDLDDSNNNNNDTHGPWSVALSFHWAGRPLVWESKGNSVSIQLVLATLDHQILNDMPIMAAREQQQQQQQQQG